MIRSVINNTTTVSTILPCRRSSNISIGLDEASCPGRRASPGINSALSALSARCLSLELKMTVQKKTTKAVYYATFFEVQKWTLFAPSVCDFILNFLVRV